MVQTMITLVDVLLRLLQTFVGVLQKKIRTRAVFNETNSTCILVERLYNVKLDKVMVCFDFCFPKAAEAVNSKWLAGVPAN